MQELNGFLNTSLLEFADRTITVGQVLQILALVLLGVVFIVWSTRFLRHRLTARAVNPDLVQMVSRAYLIVAFIILAFITLDLLQGNATPSA